MSDVRFVIPAKTGSERVANKNWRPFVDGKCLVELTIEKLLAAGVDPLNVFVSCEDEATALPVCERWRVHLILRNPELCGNEVPLTRWIREITAQVPGHSDIGWAQVCDPLFDNYKQALWWWSLLDRMDYDSLVVCRSWRGYLMTEQGQPIGWSFGEHHTPSPQLPLFRTMPFTFSILTRKAIEATGYHVGRRPFWLEVPGMHVDIDTEDDFRLAQMAVENAKTVEHADR